jgi:septum formation protein
LILASGSPQRQRLLREAGYDFRIVRPDVREPDPRHFSDAAAYVQHTAWLKARHVARQLDQAIVLAADTVVALAGRVIGKPVDQADARRILQSLSGTEHDVLTGLCVWRKPADCWIGAFDLTLCRMQELSAAETEAYLGTDRWVDKAGAYAIQDPDPYVSIVRGSHSNVVGLPLELLGRLLTGG